GSSPGGGRGTSGNGRFAGQGKSQPGRRVQLTGSYDPELFEALREWRASVALAQGRPAYTVFADATLEAVAEVRPGSLEELAGVGGVGPSKLEKYGEPVLGIVRAAAKSRG